jgi:hypothetical protein
MSETIVLHSINEISLELQSLKTWIVEQEQRINEMDEILTRITQDDMLAGRKPHKCPVCKGLVALIADEHCISCEGKGIIWG